MPKSEMFYQDETLYISMSGVYNKKNIKVFRKKLYNIIDRYGVNEIVINKKSITEIDSNAFYDMLDDYDIKYGGTLTIEE